MRSSSRSRRSSWRGSSVSWRSQSRSASRCSAATARTSRRSAASTRRSSRGQRGQPSITPASRAKIVQWLYDCYVDYLDLSRECVAVVMGYVDRFVSSPNNNKHAKIVAEGKNDAAVYQLVTASAVFLVAKQDSNAADGAVDADVLAKVSHGSYSSGEILAMESTLLEALEWRLCGPTASGMASHAIALLAGQQRRGNDDRLYSVVDFARLQIQLSASDYETSVLRRPSEVALAAVLNSMEFLDYSSHEKRKFARTLLERTKLDAQSDEVKGTRAELHRVFDNQSNDLTSRAAATSWSKTDKSVSTTTSRRTIVTSY